MRIFNAFLYSEPYEADILLAKLTVESELVEHWFAVENEYTIKGQLKERSLAGLLNGDPRFAPFLDRITVVSISVDFVARYRRKLKDRMHVARSLIRPGSREVLAREYRERPYFFAEWEQRRAAIPHLLELSGPEGWVLVTDVDEMLDAADPERRNGIVSSLLSGAPIVLLPRRRYAYDVDNHTPGTFRSVPALRVDHVAGGRVDLGSSRGLDAGLVPSPVPLVFEYSYCYEREHIMRKLETFTHEDPGSDLAARALHCNHSLREPAATRIEPAHWYEKVEMREDLHPSYILEHADELRTGVVDPEYRKARRRFYPALFPEP